jgi:hypothetical protein
MNVIPEKSLEHYIVYIHFTKYNTEKNKEGTSSFYHSEYKLHVYIWSGGFLSEWLLLNAKPAMVQLYHGENTLIFKEMMMIRSAWY